MIYKISCLECDSRCGCGYTFTTRRLGHWGEIASNSENFIHVCARACDKREGCTGFRFAQEGAPGLLDDYKCVMYTGGQRAISNIEASDGWTNCLKSKIHFHSKNFFVTFIDMISQHENIYLTVCLFPSSKKF